MSMKFDDFTEFRVEFGWFCTFSIASTWMSNALIQIVETLFNVLSKCQRKFANSHIENKKSHENLQNTEKIDQLKWHSRQISHRCFPILPIVWQSARKSILHFYFFTFYLKKKRYTKSLLLCLVSLTFFWRLFHIIGCHIGKNVNDTNWIQFSLSNEFTKLHKTYVVG